MRRSVIASSILIALTTIPAAVSAQTVTAATAEQEIERIDVSGVRGRLTQQGRLLDVIQKTEVLDASMIESKHAVNLSEALQDEPGIRVSNECSMCGAKRIMLNGLRGEHTTILIDGLPVHTMLSGFYAVDAIATTGVDRIEVARGAGASLIAPEAIGGTVNIITKEALRNALELDVSGGSHGYKALQAMATGVSADGNTGLTLIAQYDTHDQEDRDGNGVSEAPYQQNQVFIARLSHDIGNHSNVQLRLSTVSSEVFGGPVLGDIVGSIGEALAGYDGEPSEHLFEGDNINNRYIGKPWETLEWVKTDRDEMYLKWLTEINSRLSTELAWSYAAHTQNSFYEGIDYYADNKMNYLRAQGNYLISEDKQLTFGIDHRDEKMRSSTKALEEVAAFVSDSFDYLTSGLFAQFNWEAASQLELSLALRLDKVEADFVDPSKPGKELDETILSPRADIRFFHNDDWVSRVSVGRGYRAPLSFFESEHGILDAELGFQIEISELERSNSANYALSYEGDKLTGTFSVAWTQVENLASLEETEDGTPVLTQLDEKARVITTDLVLGYQVNDYLLLNTTLENFSYDRNFKNSYAIAPIEQRITAGLEFEYDRWLLNASAVWYGSRNLRDYNYEGFDDAAGTQPKPLNAPAHTLFNTKLVYRLNDTASVYAGANNLFNYTQTRKSGSPLMYDAEGNYDVAYIYGPLHGRELYAGIKLSFN